MGTFHIDVTSESGILRVELVGTMHEAEMREFVRAHNAAIDGFRGADYRVWCDISKLLPLDEACANLLEKAKRYSGSQPNFRGSAVKVASAIVALQHRRTSTTSEVMDTELISEDEEQLREHLRRVNRRSAGHTASRRA